MAEVSISFLVTNVVIVLSLLLLKNICVKPTSLLFYKIPYYLAIVFILKVFFACCSFGKSGFNL